MRARHRRTLGWFGDDVVETVKDFGEGVADVATSVVDAISDAGAEIGAALKFIAPIVALWPGVGTALSVALSAAGAYASGDRIEDAIISTASAAIPGGVPRVAFNAAADVTKTIVTGGDVKEAVIRACRNVANTAGGERAVAAFDAGLSVARGDKVQGSIWALAREQAKQGGTAELVAFDTAYAIGTGGDAGDVALAVGRDYFLAAGGPGGAAAWGVGVSLAMGKSLQDAGFVGLKYFAEGNELGERAVAFADKMRRAAQKGESLRNVLVRELDEDVTRYGALVSRSGATVGAKAWVAARLAPILEGWKPEWIEWGSRALGEYLGVDEVIARAAQSIMRDLKEGGEPDEALFKQLTQTGIASAIEKYGAGVVASRALNASYAETKNAIREDELLTAIRIAPVALSYRTALEQATPVHALGRTVVHEDAPAAELEPVAAPAPAKPRTGTAGNIALGGTIAAAMIALAWWSTRK